MLHVYRKNIEFAERGFRQSSLKPQIEKVGNATLISPANLWENEIDVEIPLSDGAKKERILKT